MAQSIEEILTPETGRLLQQAREARGLSVGDVSARLRINAQYIQNIESGNLAPLPPGPYRKAFITEYAKFLNIKLEELQGKSASPGRSEGLISSAVSAVPGVAKKMTQSAVKTTETAFKKVEEGVKDAVEEITARDLWEEAAEVRKERLGIKPKPEEEPRISIRKKTPPSEFEEELELPPAESRRARRLEFEQKPPEEIYASRKSEEEEIARPGLSRTTKLVVGLLVAIAVVIGYSIISRKRPAIVITPEDKPAATQPEQKPKPAPPVKKDSGIGMLPVVTSSNDSLIFTISAKDSVWVSVSPDVGSGFRGKLTKGEIKRFAAKEKFFLFLGNLKSVSMTLDGKPLTNIPTVPGSNLVVRNAILTRDKVSTSPPEQAKAPEPKAAVVRAKEKAPDVKKTPSPYGKKNKKTLPIRKQIPVVKPKLPR